MEKVEDGSKPVVSVTKQKKFSVSRPLLIVSLIAMLLIGGGLGYVIGKDRTESAYEKALSITEGDSSNQQDGDVPNSVKLLGIEITYTRDPQTNQKRLNEALDKITQDKLDAASFEELLQVYGLAKNSGKTDLQKRAADEMIARKNTFASNEQKTIEELKIGQ